MSEEEIIKILQHYLEIEEFDNAGDFLVAIDKIINLYNKEKEKNKELENDISEMYYKGVVLDILQDELNISRDEAIEILENY